VKDTVARLLLCPNPIGQPALKGPHGRVYLWHNDNLLAFRDDGRLVWDDNRHQVSISDFLYLDQEPDSPISLEGGLDDDDAFAYFSSVVKNESLCIDPSTWTVRNKPRFSLDDLEEYARQSKKFRRWDFELQTARETWERVKPFSRAKLIYSFPRPGMNPPFKRPSEIARLLEKEFLRIIITPKDANDLAHMALQAFRQMSESSQKSFKYRDIAVAMGYQSNQTGGTLFRAAVEKFRSLLTEEERSRLPKGGRLPAQLD